MVGDARQIPFSFSSRLCVCCVVRVILQAVECLC
jgi:hypothetical protein